MEFDLKGNKVELCGPVNAILDGYNVRGVDFQMSEDAAGAIWLVAAPEPGLPKDQEEPAALPMDRHPDEDQYPDEEAYWEALDNRFQDEGEEGFMALLRELGPHLKTALVILSVEREVSRKRVRVWLVQPGQGGVEMWEA